LIDLRMLSFAGTMDLRVNMLKLPSFNSPNRRRPVKILAFILAATCAIPAVADVRVSDPVGVHTIGKRITVTSTVSGIPPGVSSQLRSTCLRGRIVSMESSSQFTPASNVVVNFQPTIAQGGTIEFTSIVPVNHALVQLELISECPLLVFQKSWPLIMNRFEEGPRASTESRPGQAAPGLFDPESSSLLRASRKAPRKVPQVRQVSVEVTPQMPSANATEVISEAQPESAKAPVLVTTAEDPVKLASLDQSLINHGLVESEAISLGLNGKTVLDSRSSAEPVSRMENWIILAVAASSLLVLGGTWLRIRLKRRSAFAVRIPPRGQEPDLQRNAITEFSEYTAPEFTPSGHPDSQLARFGSDRVLESLMGGDESLYESDLALSEADSLYAEPVTGFNNALKTCLEMINRADVRTWDLPPSYQSMVSERNKSLEMHRTPEALILRCHIGLVELAYQEARQGHAVEREASNDLLQLLLGEHVYDLESNTTMGVPDVLMSYVKAKLCEVEGAEKRQLLRENLLSLNTQVEHQALCFHTNAWREFLSEEGLLG